MLAMSWALAICRGQKVGADHDDVSEAADKVFKPYLLATLQAADISADFVIFLDFYLETRIVRLVVQSTDSIDFELVDSIF